MGAVESVVAQSAREWPLMTNPSELLRLAERCEAATGADRELDALILEALGYEVKRDHGRMGFAVRGEGPVRYLQGTHWQSFGRYTTSIDAAMELVPEGATPALSRHRGSARGSAHITRDTDGRSLGICHSAATPALALAAAALRARAALATPAVKEEG